MTYSIVQLQGKKFNAITVIGLEPRHLNGYRVWECQCICGKIMHIRSHDLRKIKSCGCLNKHYESGTRLYTIWHGIKQKCKNEYSIHYREGNTLQDDWVDYKEFKKWAMSAGYTDEKHIKRWITKKGFNPDNCTWVYK